MRYGYSSREKDDFLFSLRTLFQPPHLYRPANLPPRGLSCAAAVRARAERAWGWRCRWWARVLGVATLGGGARAFDWFSSSSSQPPPRTVFSPSKQHALPAPRSLRRRCDAHLARARSALCAGPAATGLRGARSAGAPTALRCAPTLQRAPVLLCCDPALAQLDFGRLARPATPDAPTPLCQASWLPPSAEWAPRASLRRP